MFYSAELRPGVFHRLGEPCARDPLLTLKGADSTHNSLPTPDSRLPSVLTSHLPSSNSKKFKLSFESGLSLSKMLTLVPMKVLGDPGGPETFVRPWSVGEFPSGRDGCSSLENGLAAQKQVSERERKKCGFLSFLLLPDLSSPFYHEALP